MEVITKTCKKCGEIKELSCFSKGNGKHKKLNICKVCDAARRKAEYASLPKQVKEERAYRQRISEYKRIYGLPEDMATQLATNREGACEICGETKFLVVDHCHTNGDVRGLLCQHCNSVLGYSKDNINTLQNAIHYLRKHYGW